MAPRKIHCEDCLKALGKEWVEVHIWLDEFACVDGKLDTNHRRWRHHEEGIEEIRLKWGDEAAEAAEIHIKKDFVGKIYTREEYNKKYGDEDFLIPFPKRTNKRDYRKNG